MIPQAEPLITVHEFLISQPAIGRKKFYELLKLEKIPKHRLGRKILLDPKEVLSALKVGVK